MRKTLVTTSLMTVLLGACVKVPAEDIPAEPRPASDVVVLVEPGDVRAAPAPEPQRRGLFARLAGPRDPEPQDIQLADALIEGGAEAVATDEAPSVVAALASPTDEASFLDEVQEAIAGREAAQGETPSETKNAPDVSTTLASAPAASADTPKPERRGLLSRLRSTGGGNGIRAGSRRASDPPATAFGQMARLCDMPKSKLGAEVARSPGAGTYRLYDSAPGSTAPRPQYVTGFKDGCTRQFVAVLALFGSPVVHETKRYDPRNKRAYTPADVAYESAKGKVCKVRQGTPCPPDRLDELGRDVALFTAYSSFGEAREWFDVVLFKGDVAGQSVEQ